MNWAHDGSLCARKVVHSEKYPFEVQPTEVMVVEPPKDFPVQNTVMFRFKIKLDEGDLVSLLQHGHFWLETIGDLVQPFRFTVEEITAE